ncbi:DUF2993 domain-containing protein [Streptomyces sp. Ag109_O5-10]|uniref:LmeA family phospholipid-binding protein n=1 Tax=Streptomyces sp. Ag109_O5-10 TaxID=1855349 RepID=UPI0008959B03|nr:DUF2993 domain-containing protein [Streptomyces sp. Ag109_O5-10]SEE98671.1 Protein of unknown function [Streptomyces sp. Ag109_O5-10]
MHQPHPHEPHTTHTAFEPHTTHTAYEPHTTHAAYEEPPATPRGNRRPAVIAVALLLLLVLVPVAVDRFLAMQVESRAAKAFQQGMHTPLPPEVHVHGFPVLTQIAADRLRDVDITAHDIPAGDTTSLLPVSELSLHLAGLTKSDDNREARARSAQATAGLTYTDISNALGLPISRGSRPDRLKATVALPLGNTITATATVSAAPGNRIAFQDFQVTAGPLSAAAEAVLDKAFARPLRLQNIPDGLHLRSITTTETGLSAYFSGTSITFHAADPAQHTTPGNASPRLPT